MSTLKVNNLVPPNTGEPVTINGLNMPAVGPLSNRNLIINGTMDVAQRATQVTSVTTGGYKTCDRWTFNIDTLGTWTVDQATDAPEGFTKSFKATCATAASPAAASFITISQDIEARNLQHLKYGTSNAENLTLSFWVKSNKTGNASFEVLQYDNSFRQFTTQYQINSADTWEYKTITIPGDPSGLINDDNGTGLAFNWWLNSGSDFTGGFHLSIWEAPDNTDRNSSNLGVGDATNDYFAITGVQVELGDVATPFEHRSYGQELSLCQRYYEKGDYYIRAGVSNASIVTSYYTSAYFMTEKRAIPTITGTNDQGTFNSSAVRTKTVAVGRSNVVANVNNSGTFVADAEL